jgi:hypothetical protein
MPEVLLSARRVTRRFGQRVVLEPTDLDLGVWRGPQGPASGLSHPRGRARRAVARLSRPIAGRLDTSSRAHRGSRRGTKLFARLRLPEPGPCARALGRSAWRRAAAATSVGNQRLNLAIGLLGGPRLLLGDPGVAGRSPAAALWRLVTGSAGSAVLLFLARGAKTADRLSSSGSRVVYRGPAATGRKPVSRWRCCSEDRAGAQPTLASRSSPIPSDVSVGLVVRSRASGRGLRSSTRRGPCRGCLSWARRAST